MRGIWLLALWLGYNDVLPVALGWDHDGVGHWAHLGGFITGFGLALGMLIARQASAHGNDIISLALGKRAWAIIGKPRVAGA
jgi:membrane associated rhomboid family serine protease